MMFLKALMEALGLSSTDIFTKIVSMDFVYGKNGNNIKLMKILIKHILQNFASNSYMERYSFVYHLEDSRPYVNTNFFALIMESFAANPLQKPTC